MKYLAATKVIGWPSFRVAFPKDIGIERSEQIKLPLISMHLGRPYTAGDPIILRCAINGIRTRPLFEILAFKSFHSTLFIALSRFCHGSAIQEIGRAH